MSNKRSFAFAYKKTIFDSSSDEAIFVSHINVWNIPIKEKYNEERKPFIDFGLLVKNYRSLELISFIAPFKVMEIDIEDIASLLKENEIQLIFNDSKYTYGQLNEIYRHYVDSKGEKIIILPIEDEKNIFMHYCQYSSPEKSDYTTITIDLSKLNDIPDEIKSIYIRFRIKSIDNQSLLTTLSRKNNYLESAFTERQILDFKLNNVRTIRKSVLSELYKSKKELVKFDAIHLFLMVPADYEVSIWGDFSECRQLETDEWSNYLNSNISSKAKDIFAYHWKQKIKKDSTEKVDEFAQLIRIEHKSTNVKLILIYCLIVIILGSLGSGLLEFVKYIVTSINS